MHPAVETPWMRHWQPKVQSSWLKTERPTPKPLRESIGFGGPFMDPATPSVISAASAPVVGRSDLPDLANFRDASGHAVSFFFSVQSIPDKSHHTEVTLVRDLVREEKHRGDIKQAPGLAEDLETVLMRAEEVRLSPRH